MGRIGCDRKDLKENIVPLVINSDVIVNVKQNTIFESGCLESEFSFLIIESGNYFGAKVRWCKGSHYSSKV